MYAEPRMWGFILKSHKLKSWTYHRSTTVMSSGNTSDLAIVPMTSPLLRKGWIPPEYPVECNELILERFQVVTCNLRAANGDDATCST